VRREPASTDLASRLDVPRSNGEIVFNAPWESRVFGMVVALHEQGLFEWAAFSERLAGEIAAHPGEDGAPYYERWLASFERLLLEFGVITTEALTDRVTHLAHDDEHEHAGHHH
jgi:nitrile hydratase accessory protein